MAVVAVIALAAATGCAQQQAEGENRRFAGVGLETDTSQHSVELDELLPGGPPKDGIPALTSPKMVSLAEADIPEGTRGALLDIGGERRYYPSSIFVWHEIANDEVGGKAVAVTFCPLCGSAVLFDGVVAGRELEFGVSGLLYESNLVMYDKGTESLWSQSLGEAIVGELTGTRLELLPVQMLDVAEVREKYPDALALSTDTGHQRDYENNPYAGYEDTEQMYFPVSVNDKRFGAKELMYVFRLGDRSVATLYDGIPQGRTQASIEQTEVGIDRSGGEVTVTSSGARLPGYFEMWFSWATQHQGDGVVWEPEDE